MKEVCIKDQKGSHTTAFAVKLAYGRGWTDCPDVLSLSVDLLFSFVCHPLRSWEKGFFWVLQFLGRVSRELMEASNCRSCYLFGFGVDVMGKVASWTKNLC